MRGSTSECLSAPEKRVKITPTTRSYLERILKGLWSKLSVLSQVASFNPSRWFGWWLGSATSLRDRS
eukprot:3506617-Pyramimonas_sp.AAC.1